MESTNVDFNDLLKRQNFLRLVNRRLLEEICPSSFLENLNSKLISNQANAESNPNEPLKNVSTVNKDTQTDLFKVDFEEDGDDGYKSGPIDSSEEVEHKDDLKRREHNIESKLLSKPEKDTAQIKSQRRRPISASRVQDHSHTRSRYHQKCTPEEPDRRFIALPLPSNLYQSDCLDIGSKSQIFTNLFTSV